MCCTALGEDRAVVGEDAVQHERLAHEGEARLLGIRHLIALLERALLLLVLVVLLALLLSQTPGCTDTQPQPPCPAESLLTPGAPMPSQEDDNLAPPAPPAPIVVDLISDSESDEVIEVADDAAGDEAVAVVEAGPVLGTWGAVLGQAGDGEEGDGEEDVEMSGGEDAAHEQWMVEAQFWEEERARVNGGYSSS